MLKVRLLQKFATRTCMAAMLAGIVLTGAETSWVGSFVSKAVAQERSEEDRKRGPARETRRTEAHSQPGIKILQDAQAQMEAENFAGAASALGRIINSPGNYKGIDLAIAYKFRAYAYVSEDKYNSALKDFERALAHPSLPEWDQLDLQYNVAQLYLANEQYSKAIQALETWFAKAENPGAGAYFFAAQAYALTNRLSDAERYVEQGLAKMDPLDPQENHYRIASVVYMQRDKFSKARPILEKLVAGWPAKKEYYNQLGAVYQELGRDKDAFSMLAMAHDAKLGLTGSELKRLAQLYQAYEYPYKAAKVMEAGLNAGKVKKSKENWELLGNAWFASREMKKAIQPLKNAAKLSKDGQIYLRLCQSYAQEEDWKQTASNCRNAINKGGLKDNGGMAWQMVAIANFEQQDLNGALEGFEKCMGWDKTADSCVKWNNHVRNLLASQRRAREKAEAAEAAAAAAEKERQEEIERTLQQSESFGDSAANGSEE